jgi:hypothetical protein
MGLLQIITLALFAAGTALLGIGYAIMGRNQWPTDDRDKAAYERAVAQSGRAVNWMTAGGLCLGAAALAFVLAS